MASTLMNPRLGALHPYPFEKLRQLLAQAGTPPPQLAPINLSIGEPKHATPTVVTQAMQNAMGGLSIYPPTRGDAPLRNAVADWIARRYGIARPDPETQVLPALGSREALFAFAQTVVDPGAGSLVVCPNPFYQIYEGAALLAGAQPWFINAQADLNFGYDWAAVPADIWHKTSLVFVCSPGNPAGNVMTLAEWETLFALADKYDFIIAADECYSEIYFNEQDKPLGAMQAAALLGRSDYSKLMCFSSLSKRSNVPGMRSGFVAGDATLIKQFLLYRTYHGSAISPVVSQASIAAWNDEAHVQENRRMYREKFDAVVPLLSAKLKVQRPEAGFYLWLETPGPDTDFTRELYAKTAVTVLPGSFLARTAHGVNPGANRVRIALVAPKEQCVEAAHRIAHFLS
ncbi:Succinyldiaminopimelate aminotransferase OS=Eoetvoesiella caeni OX=645616 GN=DFR37_103196 PE=4 SV=1 [Eoetvoesiella caeni]